MPASFTEQFRIRFDECAPDGTVRAAAVLRYVVETAFAHSAHQGFPLAWYDRRGLYWLVRRAHLTCARPIPYGTDLIVTTEVVGFRRIWARRDNAIADPTGAVLGQVAMDWIFTDRTGQPARVVPEMIAAFPGISERLTPAHLELGSPPAGARADEYVVPPHVIDPRGHMNSAAYLDVFEDALASRGVDPQGRPVTYELEYFRAAQSGEFVRLFVWEDTGGWAFTITDAAGTPITHGHRSTELR